MNVQKKTITQQQEESLTSVKNL